MTRRGEIVRWSVSCIAVLACYSAAATAILGWQPRYEPPNAPLTLAMIDLEPLPDPTPPRPSPLPPPEPETIPEPPPEVKVEVPLPPVKKPPPPKLKPPEEPPPPAPVPAAPVETAQLPPTPAPPRPATRSNPSASTLSHYMARLVAHVQNNLRYPRAAQTRSEQGTAYVLLKVDRSGRVLSHKLDSSSNRRLLDLEAIAVIQRADPMPAFPPEIDDSDLELRLPVNFKLR